ncbi:UDP-N-acetylmuramoyl-tripeptide--D-alanyl-D-alanine ligase [Longilinea arvoryzae]|uniref:UDP-N-acetylmuramoyl-tripeptide--D-alanyl-D-alanine ligase n=1 Tax=Longilinea arvoryzae TaxID=360412 RepID=A0A0S7BFK3_9CHLR|nr:UDP-N-acetylmuramoyl-tripeptide--D-alanyl-D-alanine ligase [Longilinea arvoryzae]GAP14281.1 UDP-N-acetylmuramoyl-tripeptide--D-alanyl-D-alanine ligase [Longilinea arvoryzae]
MLRLADVLEALTGNRPEASLIISEAAVDSRQVIPGAMFVALPGEHVDGHDFVASAFERGAHIALVQRDLTAQFPVLDLRSGQLPEPLAIPQPPFCLWVNDSLAALQTIAGFWRQRLAVRVIGVTGSVGKSTTKELVAQVLGQRYRTIKNPGNMNNEIGLPLTLLQLSEGTQRAVLEMGFYVPGEIEFLCKLARPQVGVVTNIGTVHAERAGSQEAIARGKGELVEALPPAPEGVAILNYDDPWVRGMAGRTQARIFYYGLDARSHLWASDIEGLGLQGIRFQLHVRNETLHLHVPLIGQHSVQTVLRATAVGLVEGLSWQEVIDGLQRSLTQLRLATVRATSGALIIDDTYNASPESTLAALNLLTEIEGNKVAVLGDMLELGPYEQEGHEMVGVRAAEVANRLVTVGRLGKLIAEAARQAGMPADAITAVNDVNQATELLKGILNSDDVVLIKGSHGVRMDRIVSSLEAES